MRTDNSFKEWTVLVYAAGRNELDPEIFRSFRDLTGCGLPSEQIGLAIQIARPPAHFLALLRPAAALRDEDRWSGVRRYLASQGAAQQVADTGYVNMADPGTLADFLAWGMKTLPARRLMTVVSGHGAGFLGLLTDYGPTHRSMMSVKGFALALAAAVRRARRKIDVLVLDACHMQMLEIWYELVQMREPPCDYLVTPLGQLGMEGMKLPALLSGLAAKESKHAHLSRLLARIVRDMNAATAEGEGLMLARPDRRLIGGLRELLGQSCRLMAEDVPANPGCTLSVIDYFSGLTPYFKREAYRLLTGLCVSPPAAEIGKGRNLGPSVLAPASSDYTRYQPYYDSLQFAQNNPWTKRVGGSGFPASLTVPLGSTIAAMLAQNTGMTGEQAWDNAIRLGWLKPGAVAAEGFIRKPSDREVPFPLPPSRGILI